MLFASKKLLRSSSKYMGVTSILQGRKKKIMALSRYEYVKSFEKEDILDPLHWIVIRIHLPDYKNYFYLNSILEETNKKFKLVMAAAADGVLTEIKDVAIGYGYSNVFNFILKKETNLYNRRSSKLLSYVVSLFSSYFMSKSENVLDGVLVSVPTFDGSVFLFPQDQCLRDFLTSEQNVCHEMNLSEVTLHKLVTIANLNYEEALEKTKNSTVSDKNELLFSLCNTNYNDEPCEYKKGSILLRKDFAASNNLLDKGLGGPITVHEDFRENGFWEQQFPLPNKTIKTKNFNHFSSFMKHYFILPHTWLIIRIDGKGFHRFSERHRFVKPNDKRSLDLMTACAKEVMTTFPFVVLSYGQSDEYSFVIKRYGHNQQDGFSLISRVVSKFTATFVYLWKDKYFNGTELLTLPCFDARLIFYPTNSSLRDYLSWRQVDCHINNMYNTCFWALVLDKGYSRQKAQEFLKNTFSKDKLSILRDQFQIDYYKMDAQYLKGTVLFREKQGANNVGAPVRQFTDIISDHFWLMHPDLLGTELRALDNNDCEVKL